jgi:predicted nucleotidyltransferase
MITPVLQQELEERFRRELPHLAAEDRCALVRIIERLVEAYQPARVYLFGSKARGDYGPDSDFDLMVVVPQTTEPGYRLAQQAHSLLWDIGTAADILVWSQHAFESRLHLKASLPATIVREGRLLYAG